ncbi:MAG: hypothetical protein AM1032_000346 [Mycoplasmataceae bacterium]|nr:MAG: hypothetical protein AM1032_000346 [Mycoplasmataceae bacterium]
MSVDSAREVIRVKRSLKFRLLWFLSIPFFLIIIKLLIKISQSKLLFGWDFIGNDENNTFFISISICWIFYLYFANSSLKIYENNKLIKRIKMRKFNNINMENSD